MSNPALNRMLRGGGLTSFHVGQGESSAGRGEPHVVFSGQRGHYTFSATGDSGVNMKHDYSKKENREDGPSKKKAKKEKKGGDGDSDSDSGSDSDTGGPHFNKSGIHAKGSDADGDGKKNEGKNKKKPSFADKDKNGKVDAFEKKK